MSLRTLHKDSCLNLQALAETNERAAEPSSNQKQKSNSSSSHDSDSDSFENNDTSKIIDLNLLEKDLVDDLVETSVSSDETDVTECDDEQHVAKKHKNPQKSRTGIIPWLKNKSLKKAPSSPKGGKSKNEDENTNIETPKDQMDETKRLQKTINRSIFNESNEEENVPQCPAPKSIIKKEKLSESKKVRFATTARLITIFPHKNLPMSLKRQIWWQRTDYRNFKKTIEIITRELLQQVRSEVWFLGAHDRRYTTPTDVSKENDFGAKWWCQYGHSRRGLEHIVVTEEGQFRQRNVEKATSSILLAQERMRKESNQDPKKLGQAAIKYTAFARDLARAIGRSDSEAVQVNFDSSKTKGFRHFMPSKYDKGFLEWERVSFRKTLQSRDSRSDLYALSDAQEEYEETMSELDSFSDESNFFG